MRKPNIPEKVFTHINNANKYKREFFKFLFFIHYLKNVDISKILIFKNNILIISDLNQCLKCMYFINNLICQLLELYSGRRFSLFIFEQ